jgi:hypothetical protein
MPVVPLARKGKPGNHEPNTHGHATAANMPLHGFTSGAIVPLDLAARHRRIFRMIPEERSGLVSGIPLMPAETHGRRMASGGVRDVDYVAWIS